MFERKKNQFAWPSTELIICSISFSQIVGADVPMPYAVSLEAAALPQAKDIVLAVKKVLNVK